MKYAWLLIVLLGQCGCREKEVLKTGMEGKPMPAFDLLLSDSKTYFNTVNIPNGKPSVLYYFSSHCSYCRAQMADIVENIKPLEDVNFYVITNSSLADIKSFSDDYKLYKYSNITIGLDTSNYFKQHYNVTGVPFLTIFNKEKILTNVFEGKITARQIRNSLDQ